MQNVKLQKKQISFQGFQLDFQSAVEFCVLRKMDLVALDTPSEENDQSWVTGDLMKIWLSDLDNANIGLSHYK